MSFSAELFILNKTNQPHKLQVLFIFFGPKSGIGVGDPNAQLLSSVNQRLPVLGRHSVGNFSTELLILHHQNFEFLGQIIRILISNFLLFKDGLFCEIYLYVMNEDLPKPNGQHVLGDLSRTVTDVGHFVHSLEPSTNTVVNTLGFTPVTR